jgi:hypothetical protein
MDDYPSPAHYLEINNTGADDVVLGAAGLSLYILRRREGSREKRKREKVDFTRGTEKEVLGGEPWG